jgi:hypothetical protein
MRLLRLLLVLLVPAALVFAEDAATGITPESVLSDQVKAIASSRNSIPAKQKAIASAVKFAVLAATADVKDPEHLLKLVMEFTIAAAKAAPGFVDAIMDGISTVPGIADVDGLIPQIQAAVSEAAKTAAEAENDASKPQDQRPPSNPEFGGSTGDAVISPST